MNEFYDPLYTHFHNRAPEGARRCSVTIFSIHTLHVTIVEMKSGHAERYQREKTTLPHTSTASKVRDGTICSEGRPAVRYFRSAPSPSNTLSVLGRVFLVLWADGTWGSR
ncbi:hypothetical protein CDAR_91881 [Caerostris darwini]|uniref:Uncharacterized protein n=1 Tax=Caerostris darwini TaxID=1538125 RepID=A0AAV4QNR5_9ARAC|nr:hypothetical protein CDAR_91881 [Caerostris darwini]